MISQYHIFHIASLLRHVKIRSNFWIGLSVLLEFSLSFLDILNSFSELIF